MKRIPTMNPDRDTLLCNLPDHCVDRCDGELYKTVRAAGYDIGVRQLIDQWNCWGGTVGTFLHIMKSIADQNDCIAAQVDLELPTPPHGFASCDERDEHRRKQDARFLALCQETEVTT